MKTEADFIAAVGRKPEQDEMERVNCDQAANIGHNYCGWCNLHDKPRLHCCCLASTAPAQGTSR
jgi:hypothetical protein